MARRVVQPHRVPKSRVFDGSHAARDAYGLLDHRPIDKVNTLLATRQHQEIAWLHCVTNAAKFSARMPISLVTGAVPVDLFRKWATLAGTWAVTNANSSAFIACSADGWYPDDKTFLHANGTTTYVGSATQSAYAGANFPAVGAFATGAAGLALGDVDANFTSSTVSGTEFINIGSALLLSAKQPASGDDQFSGEIMVFRTLDPERAPISGQAPLTLWEAAKEEGSLYQAARWGIKPSGRFYLKQTAQGGSVPESVSVNQLQIHPTPLSVEAYKWQRIGAKTLNTTGNPVNNSIGVFIAANPGTLFSVEWVGVWQAERYASSKISYARPAYGDSNESILSNLAATASKTFMPGFETHIGVPAATAVQQLLKDQPGFAQQLLDKGSGALSDILKGKAAMDLFNGAKSYLSGGASVAEEAGFAGGISGGGRVFGPNIVAGPGYRGPIVEEVEEAGARAGENLLLEGGTAAETAASTGARGLLTGIESVGESVLPYLEEGVEFAAMLL